VVTLWSLAVFAAASGAQTPGTEYKLRAGDTISIDVWGYKDFSVGPIPVRPDGKISFPTIGDIYVIDLTPDSLSNIISLGLMKFVRDPKNNKAGPKVVVTLVSSNAEKYYITGAVAKPGGFPLLVPTGIREAIVAAGDLTLDADDQSATILRNGERIPVDLAAAMKGDPARNIMLKPGDTVSIDQALVTFIGAVGAPGKVALRRGLTLRQALAAVGDVRETADVERVQIRRGPDTTVVNLREITADPTKDVILKPGDIVQVDVIDVRAVPVLITGAVGKADTYRFIPGYRDTLEDAIVWTGGVAGDADLKRVKIHRSADGGEVKVIQANLETVEGRAIRLRANDFVEVPHRKRNNAGQLFSSFLGVGISLYSLLRRP
jgi:polysaccharide export outer membrane protein